MAQATNELSVIQRTYDLPVRLLPRQRARHQWFFPRPGGVWA